VEGVDGETLVRFHAVIENGDAEEVAAYVDGIPVRLERTGEAISGVHHAHADAYTEPVSEWFGPFGPLVVLIARDAAGVVAGTVATAPGAPL